MKLFEALAHSFKGCVDSSAGTSAADPLSMTKDALEHELLSAANPANDHGAIMFGLMHVAIIVLCVILMRRTARATKGSAFLIHLANSYTVTGAFYVGAAVMPLLRSFLVSTLGSLAGAPEDQMRALVSELRDIAFMWKGLDSILSLFSSFWLLTAWNLLTRYPQKETIDRRFYYVLNVLFGAVVAPILVDVLVTRSRNPIFLLLDSIIAGSAMILVGVAMWKRLRPQERKLARIWPYLSLPLLILYMLWGTAQPLYYHFRDCPMSHWYFASLLILKFLCGLAAVIAAAMCLEEKEQYKS